MVMEGNGVKRNQRKYVRGEFISHQNILQAGDDKPFKQITGQNFRKPTSHRTYGVVATKTTPYLQSSMKVRHQNRNHRHY